MSGGGAPKIETEGVYGELFPQPLLVNVVLMTNYKSKCALAQKMEEFRTPQNAMEDLEGEIHSALIHARMKNSTEQER